MPNEKVFHVVDDATDCIVRSLRIKGVGRKEKGRRKGCGRVVRNYFASKAILNEFARQ